MVYEFFLTEIFKLREHLNIILQDATRIAEMMVKTCGMSEKVGFRTMAENKLFSNDNTYAPSTNEVIDSEVKRLLQV